MTADAVVNDDTRCPDPLRSIIRAARSGDEAAFEELMVLSERRVAQIAWSILGDAEDVKDAVQETFLRLFRFLGRYDERREFFGWLTRIAVNVCRDALRRRGKRAHEPLVVDVPSGEVRADEDLIRRNDLALLRRAVEALPAKERLAIVLHDVEGMTTTDVADALGNSVSTVRVQLSKARAKLRAWIGRKS